VQKLVVVVGFRGFASETLTTSIALNLTYRLA